MTSMDLLLALQNSIFSFQFIFLWQSLSAPLKYNVLFLSLEKTSTVATTATEVTESNPFYCRHLRQLRGLCTNFSELLAGCVELCQKCFSFPSLSSLLIKKGE